MKTYITKDKQSTLFNEDCLEVLQHLINNNIKVDAIITDPPYGTTNCKWDTVIPLEVMWEMLYKLRRTDRTPIVLFGSDPFSSILKVSNIKNYKYDWLWIKNRSTGHLNAKKQPLRKTEDINVFYQDINDNEKLLERIMLFYEKQTKYNYIKTTGHARKVVKNFKCNTSGSFYGKEDTLKNYDSTERYPTNVLNFDCISPAAKVHPTEKPVELMQYLVETYTDEGDVVLDFTMGSGATGVACKNTKRQFIGIEIDKTYFDIAIDRIEK